MSTPELEPITLSPEHQARIEESRRQADAAHKEGMERVLTDAEAQARRLTARFNMAPDGSDIYGDICVNCEERWALPADKATCPHQPICEDCWPNGCPACEQQVHEDLRRAEEATQRILSAALELRTGADDLREADLPALDWRTRKDVLRHIELTTESLRRIRDLLRAQEKRKP